MKDRIAPHDMEISDQELLDLVVQRLRKKNDLMENDCVTPSGKLNRKVVNDFGYTSWNHREATDNDRTVLTLIQHLTEHLS